MTEPTSPQHLFPPGVTPGPVDLSIVIPAMNEEVTIGEFVDWCREGLAKAGVSGQILIVDSSTDQTPRIAVERGAEVLCVPKRGLGRAYIDAIPFIRGKWIVMGDADLTYDFRELAPFVEQFRKGAEFVMGSRFHGSIESGAMPPLHQYFGTPLTTWILNVIYHSRYSDIHCGMRGLTAEALQRIDLQSQSWEYASEMVLKAARLGLRIAEVPVKFYKDREGRMSHHRRMGWLSPWIAGWINLKVMLVYSPDSFLLKPGVVLLALGLGLTLLLVGGPVQIGPIVFSLYWMLLGLTCATLGYSCVQIGVLARILHRLRPGFAQRIQTLLTYNRGMIIAGSMTLLGVILGGILLVNYISGGLRLSTIWHPAIFGLLLIILGFQTFCFTLLVEMTQRVVVTPRSNV
ncbi:glycosyl transferase family 2 [Chthoniobacter flavus Ellin428]|uniref:Glycosyl transferase family 2 n=1 Tax=Chthoniobacter flavus Ellin428 TaxID=497964 RepID=B4D0U6_9BACT|nr:glycosyltransferase family 2 protein [Chthoniobacter flavus]EDY19958.1 glycosyl transferase family 2 [Chthoniobacter flavus Ellin428]TCO91773.1 glycosyltransferase involved in cell wall biosynthesis [Chthoniobacter flavus]